MSFPRGKAAIVGAATYGMGESPGALPIELAVGAAGLALKQAGLTFSDVDAVLGASSTNPFFGLQMAEYLGIHPKLTNNNAVGGSAFMTHVLWASMALSAGLCDTVLISYGSTLRTSSGKLNPPPSSPFEAPYNPRRPISGYALAAMRHMHEYGTTREQLADVAVAARQWAQLNPKAYKRDPLTREDVLASRMIADPLSLLDCCLVTDGGAAIVMTRADRAKDLTDRPVHILGAGEATHHLEVSNSPGLTTTSAKDSGRRAFEAAGLRPSDIDVVQLYDAFTINTVMFLEDLGFCPKGEGGAFVTDGRIAPGGSLPVNTNGGGLSCVHPGMYGLFALVEAVDQLMWRAGERQVERPETAIAHGNGVELSSQATVVLGGPETVPN
ncbi:thiolase [Hyphomonas adhaerens MHS-3]|uniref:Thiolase n=1 Tax=Hyphomonas adhaerens MHS-3 TaxID=1280949 RepID=A0A069E7Q3_9PROT|nr:acetyl-CoA acetyltransferase [Hyphomonas adhaerens]KCZ86009.1 thiolase [Hyphomonas adhaerens MHS-3]